MQEICVIIPCYNEYERLDLDQFSTFISTNSYFFLFVNDGSIDETVNRLSFLKSSFPEHTEILDLEVNCGKGEAVRQGVLWALKLEKFKYIGFLDADLATPLTEIDYLTRNFSSGYKIVAGCRVKRLGALIKRNLKRHYMGRIFATFASFTLKIKMYDSQCGAKFFETNLASEIFKDGFKSKWLFDLELIYRYNQLYPKEFSNKIIEVPLRSWEEKGGSKIKIIDLIKAPVHLFRIKAYSSNSTKA